MAFDHRTLAIQLQDLTTFQMPLGSLHLTTLPMGATNSVQILQGDISFIIQDKMPDIAAAFMDDVNVRGPPTQYETNSAGWYIYPLLLRNPQHNLLPFCVPLLQTSHASARTVNTSAWMINTMWSFQKTLGSISSFGSI